MDDSFISALVVRNPDSIAMSTSIISTNRLNTREMVFVMVLSYVLFQFVLDINDDCRSTFVASQNLLIP